MDKSIKAFTFPVGFETKPQTEIPLVAFLFTRSGKLIESNTVRGDAVSFKTEAVNPRLYKIYVAPGADKKIENVKSVAELERFKPFEVVINVSRDGVISPVKIPNDFSRFWLLRSCRVRGKVIKNFSIGSISQDRGICNARVHICEVDRLWWWINKIPDYIIAKIPDIIVTPEWPFPIPDPEPNNPLGPVIAGLNPQLFAPSLVKNSGFNTASEFSKTTVTTLSRSLSLNTDKVDVKTASVELSSAQSAILASPQILNQLNSNNVSAIRKTIVDNFQLFHPYFCHISWLWPYFYRYDQVALVYTDLNGSFDTNFWYWYDGDQPDLYFWVEYLIDGVWTTVYKPTIPCHTYWDYACGSEVTIRVTDARVRWECNDIVDGDIVWIKTIGSSASVSRIKQNFGSTVVQGKTLEHIGLSDILSGGNGSVLDAYRSPFGGTLNFVVQFGSGLPSNGMYYYRWNYRKLRNADLSILMPPTTPVPLHQGQALYKSYTFEYYDAAMHKHIGGNSFRLGPVSKGGEDDLYIIPPVFPASSPVNASESSPLWDQNTITASVDSTQFSDGLYEFTLELFDVNGHKLHAIPKQLFQVPDAVTFAPSIDAPAAYIVPNGSNADGFKMVMRIDNGKCEANIYKIKVNGAEVTSDCCGFVPYPPNANIEIAYRAYHPNNLGTFGFVVQKGTCNDVAQQTLTNASGMVIGDANSYVRDSLSIYRHTFTPGDLLGSCLVDGKAAFAEQLNVYTLATNGYDRLSYLDAPALAAFALEPV